MKAIMRDEREMKNSGIEWLEFIPVQWNYSPIKRVVIDRSGGAWGEEPQNINDIICMRIADFDFERGFFADKDESLLTKRSYTNAQIQKLMLQYGDLLVEKSGGGENTPVGRAVLFNKEYDALFANFMDRLRFDMQTVYPLFVAYYWRAMYYKTVTTPYIKQTTGIQNLNIASLLEKEYIFYPSLKEQQLITNYLDDRCSKIDAIIAEAKASIEEYKELKQAVIYEAVTKGLDKNVEMKDSGIEWIGKIPAHWTVKKIKRLGTARNGLTYSPNDMTDEIKGTLVIRSSNIQNGKWDYRDNVYVSCEIPDELMLKTGDIVICSRNGSRNLIGKNAMVDSNNIQTFGAFMMVYRSHIDNKEYIFWLLNSGMFKYYLPMFFTATINQLTRNNFNEMTVPFTPSKDEQDQIVQYIEKKVSIFDSLIAEKQSLIEDLEDYKKSLIYEVVTGKRKVVE